MLESVALRAVVGDVHDAGGQIRGDGRVEMVPGSRVHRHWRGPAFAVIVGSAHDHFRVQTNGEWRIALHEWILAIVVDHKGGELVSWLGAIGMFGKCESDEVDVHHVSQNIETRHDRLSHMLHRSRRTAHRIFASARGSTSHKLHVQGTVAIRIDVGNRTPTIGTYAHEGATGGCVRSANGCSLSASAI